MLRAVIEFSSIVGFVIGLQAPVIALLQPKTVWMVACHEADCEDDDDDDGGPNGGLRLVRAPGAQCAPRGF